MDLARLMPPRRLVVGAAILAFASCNSSDAAPTSDAARFEFLMGIGSPKVASEITLTVISRQQKFIRECMAKRGFDYSEQSPTALYSAGPEATMTAQEFASKYGFGYITLAGVNSPVPADVPDPNAASLSKLSQSGQAAWTSNAASCEHAADSDVQLFADSASLRLAAKEAQSKVRSDSRVFAANVAWRSCMASRGLDFTDRQSMLDTLQRDSDSLVASGAQSDDSTRHVAFEGAERREIAIAEVDLQCRGPLLETLKSVTKEYQGDFIATNRDAFG